MLAANQGEVPWDVREEPFYALPVRPLVYYPPALILLLKILAGWNKVRDQGTLTHVPD
jgi:hypothetical protein